MVAEGFHRSGLHKLGLRLNLSGAALEISTETGTQRIPLLEGWARQRNGNRELVGCFSLPTHQSAPLETNRVTLMLHGNCFRISVLNALPDAPGRWSFLSSDHVARLKPAPQARH
jgi:hypothetical protein